MSHQTLGFMPASKCDHRRVPVLLPYPFPGPFDYRVPTDLDLKPGDIVLVPLNRRQEVGVVWDAPAGDTVPDDRLKSVAGVIDTPPMGHSLRRFIDWIAAYTLTAPGDVLAMALRVVSGVDRPVMAYRRAIPLPAIRLTPTRQRVLDALAGEEPLTAADLMRRSEVSAAVLRAMAAAGLLATEAAARRSPFLPPDPDYPGPALSPEQTGAAGVLRAAVTSRRFSVTLLDGVTGSGKTEVYLEAVAACLSAGRQALVMLPEIALSSQWTERFQRRFGVAPAVWHSDLPPRTRKITRKAVAAGAASVVVGARSALFLPFPDLGLVVVDEEHEAAFKQQDGVIYNARDMAIVRARLCACPAVLVSATPSLETVMNVEAGRYQHLRLSSRHGGATLPKIELVDLRETPPDRGRFLAPPLIEAVRQTLTRGEQAMLFLNRRGYAPLTLCRRCGHRMQCPNCTAWLVEHRTRHLLLCHHCGHTIPIPPECPACDAKDSLTPVGPGIERITEEAAAVFPDARRLIMASDTISGPNAAAEAAHAIEERRIDLIIGTQLVAKGWHFPHLTFVGVVDADLGLAGGELRASERTVQLLHQVAGRAGRAEAPGRVMLQTFVPDHPVMQALLHGDLDAFMANEAESRRDGDWPPYGRLAALIVSADTALMADTLARDLARAAPRDEGATVLGPAPAPMALLRGRHRRRLLLKVRRDIAVQPILRNWLSAVRIPRGSKVDVDVDPISFL
jgi:primosomal protein N' (replication factor Y) (superfamily II helicase)